MPGERLDDIELHLLLEKYLIEARRDEIHSNFEESKVEYKSGKLKFSSNIKELKKSVRKK